MANERILIVDDNPFNVKLATFLLASEGFELRSAVTAENVLSEVSAWQPQLILMDRRLPDADGFTLARRLRAVSGNSRLVVVAFSVEATSRDQEEAFDAGCDGFIAKPIDVDTFCSAVRRYLP